MLSGLLYPTSGEATVLGRVPSRREAGYLRRMTMVMGNRNQLQWDLPALDSFELIRAIYRLEPVAFRQTRDEFVELLDLGELVRKPVRNLSLGERMKMEFVGALLHRPQVLFLDEPTSGLDPHARARMWDEIRNLRELGTTVFLTTHYLEEADALCDRLAIIDHGRIVAEGTADQLKQAVAGDVVTLGVDAPRERVIGLVGGQPFVREIRDEEDELVRLYVERGETAVPQLLRVLDAAGVATTSISLHKPSLDDVFLRQTGRSLRDEPAAA
jgi:ABC-2 type transport system ATP-binding protein